MESLIVRAALAVGGTALAPASFLAGLRNDDTPSAPSSPVEIGTKGVSHAHAEIASWRNLILMLIGAIVIGAVVLLYVVRQRRRLLHRRRLRRMAEAARLTAADGPAASGPAASGSAADIPEATPAPGAGRHPRAHHPHRVT
jgi:hypothetical protein